MDILHRGTPPAERAYEATCHTCQTVVRFTEREAKKTSDQREGTFLYVRCPVCKDTISLHVAR